MSTTSDTLVHPAGADGLGLEVDGLPGHFEVHYQPEFDLATRTVTGCEGLLRWIHPEYGLLRPGAALHRSRWSSALARAEDWAITAVVRQSAAWRADGHDIQVALNVSRRQLDDEHLARTIDAAILLSGAEHTDLRVDVPVGSFTTQRPAVRETTRALADLGITIVADDVVGDQRIQLAGFPVGILKVDLHTNQRRRLRDLHPRVAASVKMAQDLGAVSVAKAVRRVAELSTLEAAGFDRAFGDMLSPALLADDLLDLVATDPRDGVRHLP